MGEGFVKQDSVGAVRAWEADVVIPTYAVPEPDRNPMFLDRRVYQGSSGKVYPNPFTDRVSDVRIEKKYRAVYLENEFLHLMILPEIGGRVHVAQDRTNGYDFIYRQRVIKPALVGLLGPWISGGIEFNWPQHHRPSTFMPVDFRIERHRDGSRTVWLGELEPMNRMKGMVGICLYPGRALIEAKVRLYNRTPFPQTFLWWANAGIHVHDRYQAFFPPDVSFVADHAKRAMSWYPIARTRYYGVNYDAGVDLSWYKNIPVPTSYMVIQSNYDFFGGYDHERQAGMVHIADRRIAPGKKLWTWGNHEFGYAWDRELTDSDGPYIELMAGVYTDNQPDFSWLQPYETRTFRQYWYPIQQIGPVKNATSLLAVNLEPGQGCWKAGVCSTAKLERLRISVSRAGQPVLEREAAVKPGEPFVETFRLTEPAPGTDLLLQVFDSGGRELIRYQPEERRVADLPPPAKEPPAPKDIPSGEELYLTGLHLEQYRHATRSPESYWREALARDPLDARSNNAMGMLFLRRGLAGEAEQHFTHAIRRLTGRNPNPYDGEAFYNLGLALVYQDRMEEASAAFAKAAWNHAWKSPACYQLAAIACRRADFGLALEHLDCSLTADAANLKARNLKTAVLRAVNRRGEASRLARDTARLDPLDFRSRYELVLLRGRRTASGFFRRISRNTQTCLDLAYEYAEAGFWTEGARLLEEFATTIGYHSVHPMVYYSLGHFAERLSDTEAAADYRRRAAKAPPDYCFPARIEEMHVLQSALRANPADARAHYYLGNLLYDKQRRTEAIGHWEQSCRIAPEFSIPWRNLGIACFNVRWDPAQALECYERAFQSNPADARLLYELDQLRKRTGAAPEFRLAELEKRPDLVGSRDDLTIELVTLYNQAGLWDTALEILAARRFHPWEGGEGLVSAQYVIAHLHLGRKALESGRAADALKHFDAARIYPRNLGEGKHLLTEERDLDYFAGLALQVTGDSGAARERWEAAASPSDAFHRLTYYRALALRKLGRAEEADGLLEALRTFAGRRMDAPAKIDYFATSLPNFLLFDDDLAKRNRVECLFLRGLANHGLGRVAEAARDFREVLQLDRNHLWARQELCSIDALHEEVGARS